MSSLDEVDVKLYRPAEGDVLVLRTPNRLRPTEREYLTAQAQMLTKKFGVQCVVLEEGLELEVLRREPIDRGALAKAIRDELAVMERSQLVSLL